MQGNRLPSLNLTLYGIAITQRNKKLTIWQNHTHSKKV